MDGNSEFAKLLVYAVYQGVEGIASTHVLINPLS